MDRTNDIIWTVCIVVGTIFLLKWFGLIGVGVAQQMEKQTPVEAVTELQNNYELSKLELEKDEALIEYLENLLGKDQLKYIKDLERRPTKGDFIFGVIMMIIIGGLLGAMLGSIYTNNKMEKYKDEMWDKIYKLPNKYQKIFEEKE